MTKRVARPMLSHVSVAATTKKGKVNLKMSFSVQHHTEKNGWPEAIPDQKIAQIERDIADVIMHWFRKV